MNPNDHPKPPPLGALGDIDPGEILARALHTAAPSPGATRWTPPAPAELARLLPQYHIESLLGHGGMGAVYKGRQAALDRPVAIKLLPAEMAADAQFIARFQREARTLAKLQHPGIVTVYDFGQTSEGHLYFVMEFVDGTDLHRILHAPGGLNPAQALELISQICDALHYAHSKGVIHRDIKPGNILVTTESRAKLADFGLARPIKEESTMLTGTNVVMGTAACMAPEQQEGRSDQRADIYALGVMLYEMLCGQRPSGAFDPPSHRVQVDVRLDDVVLKAMQQQPERRYQQVSEMKTDVDRIRTTPLEKAKGGKRKAEGKASRVRVAAILAAWVAVLSAAGFFLWEKVNPSRAAHAQAALGSAVESSPALQRAAPSAAPGRPDGLKPPTTLPATATPSAAVTSATKDDPFVNTLGMKFIPVPITGGPTGGQRVLFSVWETRVQDYEVLAKETKREWPKPDFEQGPTHPAVNVSWGDAQVFCRWLTTREQAAGRLPAEWRYRLPDDHEWSCAAGIGLFEKDAAKTPEENDGVVGSNFPWGKQWPSPMGAGNFAGEELQPALAARKYSFIKMLTGYRDAYLETAPVGSFGPDGFGLCDLGGNAREWCEDWFNKEQKDRVLRGASWTANDRKALLSSVRGHRPPEARNHDYGFRCVLSAPPAVSTTGTPAPTAGAAEASAAGVPFTSGAALPTTGWRPLVPDWNAAKTWPGVTLLPDGWVRLTGARLPIDVQQHDVALRARFRYGSGKREGVLIVRNTTADGKVLNEYSLVIQGPDADQARLSGRFLGGVGERGVKPLGYFSLPRTLTEDEEYELAITAIGDELTAYFDGQPIGRATDAVCTGGGVNIWGNPGVAGVAEFKNAEWLPLSAEPWQTPTATKPATPPPSRPAPGK